MRLRPILATVTAALAAATCLTAAGPAAAHGGGACSPSVSVDRFSDALLRSRCARVTPHPVATWRGVALALALAFAFGAPRAARADGEIDTSFGATATGIVVENLGHATDRVAAMATAPGGRIVIAGDTANANRDIVVIALRESGVIDTSFAGSGRVTGME